MLAEFATFGFLYLFECQPGLVLEGWTSYNIKTKYNFNCSSSSCSEEILESEEDFQEIFDYGDDFEQVNP